MKTSRAIKKICKRNIKLFSVDYICDYEGRINIKYIVQGLYRICDMI